MSATTIFGSKSERLRVVLVCPWCGVTTELTSGVTHRVNGSKGTCYMFVTCHAANCHRACMLEFDNGGSPAPSTMEGRPILPTVYPPRASDYAPLGVAEQLARDMREAEDCYSAGHYYAAALVGRRVLQVAARLEIGERKNLKAEIDALPPDRVPNALKAAAHEIRLVGNDAAHADEVTAEDVASLLEFLRLLFDQLYVVPAKVMAMRERRASTGST